MSYPTNPVAPAAPARPVTVTISSYLLYLVAGVQIVGLIVALSVIGDINDAYGDVLAGTGMENAVSTMTTMSIVFGAAIGVVVAAGLVVLGFLNGRGKKAARIVTWVLGGIFACCSGFGLIGQAAGGGMFGLGGTGAPNAPDPAEVQRTFETALPSWYTPMTIATSSTSLVALLIALILLALPASNEFFRKPQVTSPAMGYPGYPPVPGVGYPHAGPSPSGSLPTSAPPSSSPPAGPAAPGPSESSPQPPTDPWQPSPPA